jgi:hypothetical protein
LSGTWTSVPPFLVTLLNGPKRESVAGMTVVVFEQP